MKKILSILLVVCTLLALCGCSKSESAKSSGTIEGSGFKSAEKAILAYAEALQSGDVKKILSTFAIETYVDNLPMEEYLRQVSSYVISMGLVSEDDYSREIRLIQRQYQLTNHLSHMYMNHSTLGIPMQPITFSTRSDYHTPADFIDDMVVEDWMEILEEMEIGDVLAAEDVLQDRQTGEGYKDMLESMCVRYGCDEIVPMAVEITLDGVDYYLCTDVACYDGKWYNLSPGGTIAIMLGASIETGYLAER